MSERSGHEGLFGDRDQAEVAKVLFMMGRINDAYESGSGEDVNGLIREMHDTCDPRVITFVEAENRRARQSRWTDRSL